MELGVNLSSMAFAMIVSAVLAMLFGSFGVPLLRRLNLKQTIYELSPSTHAAKQGIPTMGGLFFVPAAIIAALLFMQGETVYAAAVILGAVCFMLVGGVDDMLKVIRKRNLGLTPIQKIVPQAVFAIVLAWLGQKLNGTAWLLPFAGTKLELSFMFIPLTAFVIVGTVNSANLLDGLDGLCGSCSCVSFITEGICVAILAAKNLTGGAAGAAAVLCFASAGALMGFLVYNFYPARVFMGDTGSFYVGGALAAAAVLTGTELLLPILALPMLVSSLSDILQVVWCRTHHGKRLLMMAPLHHHFEMSGIPETRIVTVYCIINILLGALCVLGV